MAKMGCEDWCPCKCGQPTCGCHESKRGKDKVHSKVQRPAAKIENSR